MRTCAMLALWCLAFSGSPIAACADQQTTCHRFTNDTSVLYMNAEVRAYYFNDQRLQWTGLETSFGGEAALMMMLRGRSAEWTNEIHCRLFVNQRYGDNILVDTPERQSYANNFDVEPLEISELSLAASRGDWSVRLGKFRTPFGRTYFPLFMNSEMDAPFIRTESIAPRETGFLVTYHPNILVCDVSVVNGGEDLDTNSSKGIVSRLGLDSENWSIGGSIKVNDGTGSEQQKQFRNHVGMDMMLRSGRFTLSGEVIQDEYGFRQPGFDPDDITWGRSIYYRDLNKSPNRPITGIGYYCDLNYSGPEWCVQLNYGAFNPESIGHRQHDITKRRGIVRLTHALAPRWRVYCAAIIENGGYMAQDQRPRRGLALIAGLQAAL